MDATLTRRRVGHRIGRHSKPKTPLDSLMRLSLLGDLRRSFRTSDEDRTIHAHHADQLLALGWADEYWVGGRGGTQPAKWLRMTDSGRRRLDLALSRKDRN